MYRNISYFPGLTPLRFLAALLVVIFHAEETRKFFELPNLTDWSLFANGPLAVTFFFVLSGFLITYLLLKERRKTGKIRVGRFYMRRILRIWPLYFLLVFIGLVLIPLGVKADDIPYESPYESGEVVWYFVLFLPFVVNLLYGNHALTPLWSIGVEEIYYLAWAPAVKFMRRLIVPMLVFVIVIKAVLAVVAIYFIKNETFTQALYMLQFEAMAIGGLGAYALYHRQTPIERMAIFSPLAQCALVAPLVIRIFAHRWFAAHVPLYSLVFDHAVATPLLLMCLFTWFIVNMSVNERRLVRVDSRWMNFLGDISYGVYMYHMLVISAVITPFLDDHLEFGFWGSTALLYGVTLPVTILIAAASKKLFEDQFLKLKHRFEPQPTLAGGDMAAAST